MRLILFLILISAGCSKPVVEMQYPTPSGKIVFAVEVVQYAFGGPLEGKNGYYFYLNHSPSLSVFEYRDNSIVEWNSVGSIETTAILKKLDTIEFEDFELSIELQNTNLKRREIALRNGSPALEIATADGAEYRIIFNYKDIEFDSQMWNPRPQINLNAPYNKKIEKLRSVIELFAETYGHATFGI